MGKEGCAEVILSGIKETAVIAINIHRITAVSFYQLIELPISESKLFFRLAKSIYHSKSLKLKVRILSFAYYKLLINTPIRTGCKPLAALNLKALVPSPHRYGIP